MATAEILIIGGGGSFPVLGAVLVEAQNALVSSLSLGEDGVVLHARTKYEALDGVPFAFKLDNEGVFPCKPQLSLKARPVVGEPLAAAVERAIQDYLGWHNATRPCYRDGFNKKRCGVPPPLARSTIS